MHFGVVEKYANNWIWFYFYFSKTRNFVWRRRQKEYWWSKTIKYVTTLNLGSRPKQGFAKLACQMRSPRVTFHVFESAWKCEGMNPHTPKGAPTLGVEVPMDSRTFRGPLQGPKIIELKISFYHWKALRT